MNRSYPFKPRPRQDHAASRPLLKRMDQAAIAGLVVAALLTIVGFWTVQAHTRSRLIELDRAPRVPVAFELDINAAEWPELSVLPNIGETLAKRIVESREAEGPFVDLDDVQRVRGIGPRTLEGIRPYLRPIPPGGSVARQ